MVLKFAMKKNKKKLKDYSCKWTNKCKISGLDIQGVRINLITFSSGRRPQDCHLGRKGRSQQF